MQAGWFRALVGSSAVRLTYKDCGRMAPVKKAKAKSGVDPKAKKGEKGGLTGALAMHAKLMEARGEVKYIRDADQMAKDAEIAKNYTRKMFARHIEESDNHSAQQKWLTRKIRLRDQAIAALPVELQEEGKSLDDRRPPMDRHVWTEFPPIPGFEDMTQDKERQEKDKARQRQTKA